jgi:RNA polymerase sigma-70 factor (sigma-E family)
MKPDPRGFAVTLGAAGQPGPGRTVPLSAEGPLPGGQLPAEGQLSAEGAVTELYQAHALGLTRLAYVMLGDRPAAEDVVQEAFCGLYRRWSRLSNQASAVRYVRSSVLNGCRSVLRRNISRASRPLTGHQPAELSAESVVLTGEERREVMRALRRLPRRQREALVLKFYLDLSAAETAATMGISPSSARSAITRGLASLGRMLEESS